MSRADDRAPITFHITRADLHFAPEPPRFGVCVYCGDRSGYGLACGAHLRLLALDPTYADASGRMDETDYLPETDETDC